MGLLRVDTWGGIPGAYLRSAPSKLYVRRTLKYKPKAPLNTRSEYPSSSTWSALKPLKYTLGLPLGIRPGGAPLVVARSNSPSMRPKQTLVSMC